MNLPVESGCWVSEPCGDSVTLASDVVAVVDASAVDGVADLWKGSNENFGRVALDVVLCAWLALDAPGEEDSKSGGSADTVVQVVDVTVTVPACELPKVRNEVGGALVELVHVVDELSTPSVFPDPTGG